MIYLVTLHPRFDNDQKLYDFVYKLNPDDKISVRNEKCPASKKLILMAKSMGIAVSTGIPDESMIGIEITDETATYGII